AVARSWKHPGRRWRQRPGAAEASGPVRSRSYRVASLVLIALGAGLRLWQYGANASQWLDELALSRGILGLSLPALLTGHLPFFSVAPPRVLLIQEAAVLLL